MFSERDRLLVPPSHHQNNKGGYSQLVFLIPAALFIAGVLGNIRPVKNNGRGVSFQCRKGVNIQCRIQ
jgi:hypothetical protein